MNPGVLASCHAIGETARVAQVRFCSAADGVRLAYAVDGRGPPLVRVATWLTHLELDRQSPIWGHWIARLSEGNTLIRYDERGCGLSDAEIGNPSLETWVGDLEAVVDAASLERFALLGISQGAAIAVAYAAFFPERVSDLVLYGGYARGRQVRGQGPHEEALVAAIRAGWKSDDPAFRRVFSMLFFPNGTPDQMAWHDELLRATTTVDTAIRLFRERGRLNVVDDAPNVRARTLVMHARGDRAVPVEEGRLLAALIPGARFVSLDSVNHILLADEPAWEDFVTALHEFVATGHGSPRQTQQADKSPGMSTREIEVLQLIAGGKSNREIADTLSISMNTVARHISNIFDKVGAANRTEAAAYAHHHRLAE
jgi:pimeloyl-ACP methyl ester carboxylesterase/DNA-binding CsgD family transcriptional regulator